MSKAGFQPYAKTPRLYRDIVITEKIDGTNGAVVILPESAGIEPWNPESIITEGSDGNVYTVKAQSRNRFCYPGADNAGFGQWVWDNAQALIDTLGPGIHFGEWWGKGIQRGYGMTEKRFSLFNTHRWDTVKVSGVPGLAVVPVLYVGPFTDDAILNAKFRLMMLGSEAAHRAGVSEKVAAEGIIVFHSASNTPFKVLIENDNLPKGAIVGEVTKVWNGN